MKRINPALMLLAMIIWPARAPAQQQLLLWNRAQDSAALHDPGIVVIGVNGKTCHDCLNDLSSQLQRLPAVRSIYITMPAALSVVDKKSLRNELEGLPGCDKCRFFIHTNLGDELLNKETQTPVLLYRAHSQLSFFSYQACFEYGRVNQALLQKIGQ